MNSKSKLVTFILSVIPGLPHLYLGVRDRAAVFGILFFGAIFGTTGIIILSHNDDFFAILVFALPIIWLVALVDALYLTDQVQRIEKGSTDRGNEGEALETQALNMVRISNRKILTVIFSMVPGAGHMYLGLQKQGLQLMSIFFFMIFLMGWLNMSLFFFALPVIWFYSLFDALQRVDDPTLQGTENEISLFTWIRENPKWVGWGLILLGCFAVVDRIVFPFITYEIRNYFQTAIVAAILIGSGIKLLIRGKQKVRKEVVEQWDDGE